MNARGLGRFLLVLAIGTLGACNGTESLMGDRTAPRITLSPSSTAVGGGETVAITLEAVDDVDGSVAATLICSGGELAGRLLVTPFVTTVTTISCTARASDQAGNMASQSTTITVSPATASLALSDGTRSLRAGSIGIVSAQNLTLDQSTYEGNIAGKTITLIRDGNSLAFLMPFDLAAGQHQLTARVGGRLFRVEITAGAPPAIVDPLSLITSVFDDNRSRLVSLLNNPGRLLSSEEQAGIRTLLDRLDASRPELGSLSQQDATRLATFLAANDMVATASSRSFIDIISNPSQCPSLKSLWSRTSLNAIVGAIAAAHGAALLAVPGGQFLGIITITSGFVLGLSAVDSLEQTLDRIKQDCSEETTSFASLSEATGLSLIAGRNFVTPLAVESREGFKHDKARSFQLVQSYSVIADVRGIVDARLAELLSVIDSYSVLSPLRGFVSSLRSSGEQIVPANRASLSSVSGDVTGAMSVSGDIVALTFKSDEAKLRNVDFSFDVTYGQGKSLTVPARMIGSLPEADDAAISIPQGETSKSLVQVRGALTLEVVQGPANGTVTLNDDGSFFYRPTLGYTGSDRFTYRARNEIGVSEPATVLVTVTGDFEGPYALTVTRSGDCFNSSSHSTTRTLRRNGNGYEMDTGPAGFAPLFLPDGRGELVTDQQFTFSNGTSHAVGTVSADGQIMIVVTTQENNAPCAIVTTIRGARAE